jgi:hypothetical protein
LVHLSETKLNPTRRSSGGVTWGYSTNRTLGHQFATLIGSPASASSPPLVHRSATKLNLTSSRTAYGLDNGYAFGHLPLNFSRALWRPSGQYGPSLHRVINETAFQKKRGYALSVPSSTPMLRVPQFLNLSALNRPVKGAWRGYDVAPVHHTVLVHT